MYSEPPHYVIGFHGTDASIVERVITGREPLRASENEYDWLGHGIYFGENDPQRALEFAAELKVLGKPAANPITKPAVLGAIIDPAYCLNFLERTSKAILRLAYEGALSLTTTAGIDLPWNRGPRGTEGGESLLRYRDCAVIQMLHRMRAMEGKRGFDTVRGVFWEGGEVYPGSAFREKDHIQLCVRNINCIKGYFLPLERRRVAEEFCRYRELQD